MTAVWPAGLPQFVQEQGFSESLPDQTLESQMDTGPPKVRGRFTMNYRPMQASIRCTIRDQEKLFEHFYRDVLGGGALPFHWVNPTTQVLSLMRFKRPPPQKRVMGDCIEFALNLWQLRQYAAFRFDSTVVTFDSTEHLFDETHLF